ncbi:phosphatidylserine decarboxylase-domain-containing protein [Blyttiomyces helicus]|uniref:Phosphatidylserine decarboxylase-domain-containing protein n=1 Tax=Blyttiomyces helicus TaxID=388810 RepID=A0A4P9W7T1_9FUNG|nr:phosphatidylserine decarboxylase-domain-containing protein [Blyttiomyces helicus]|eukprot:RKO87108.1 phosphatidylserine decarboxylase-domain-containing protein [Blyttiomyces helicus]
MDSATNEQSHTIAALQLICFSRRDEEERAQREEEVEVDSWPIRLYTYLPLRFISRLWGTLNALAAPVPPLSFLYTAYSSAFGCNHEEMKQPDLQAALKKGARGVERGNVLVSPSDGRVLHFGRVSVETDRIEQMKGIAYSVSALLGASTASLAPVPKPGNALFFCVIYLAPGDDHRLRRIEIFSVSPWMVERVSNLFVLNERVALLGERQHGFFSMIPVGATNAGSIVIDFDPPTAVPLRHGDQMGGFKLGSTVVLVFEAPEKIAFSTVAGERVRVGEAIGNW